MQDNELLLAFYGDDFTGSTDAMEALSQSGYRTVLFLEAPSPDMLKRFEGIRCVGVAGTSRAKNPEDLGKEVGPIMERLAQLPAGIIHYKTCSTFDSSPDFGSIGEAISVTLPYFKDQETVPLLVGAPALGRYTVFGHHFARYDGEVYRLDRHPVMSRHPVTPMGEADLRLHLQKQLDAHMELVSIVELEGGEKSARTAYRHKLERKPAVILFDALGDGTMRLTGQLIWESGVEGQRFVVGSSGVEYALTAYWEEAGIRKSDDQTNSVRKGLVPASRILAVSGSASPVSQRQVETAIEQGFIGLRIPPECLAEDRDMPEQLLKEAIQHLNEGRSVVLYTALGPEDPAIAATRKAMADKGIGGSQAGEHIGRQLGRWTKHIMLQANIGRVVIAGGDTSGFVTSEMGIYGLEMALPVSPGAPLCKVYSQDERMDGLELALKGGQFGSPDYFIKVRDAASG
ncbi:four-carbon acid sugar kinase family protein [Paenibacillus sp. 1011MAR3C5]|uniref:four-carbon acid sugar kinase family protein n=1 Tax=Paenibacillus sp. 1011MAR3C5 TaxID=1675787 RepID=UPI000E6CDE9D|nr:four-carbon acid sugar kinase family protein [Paenibacillus sp. 1011MAR3C5]RJE83957.1 four-carbon acid sugar kinase family protein [Paenibacillus sp. 1011MAR3C5]